MSSSYYLVFLFIFIGFIILIIKFKTLNFEIEFLSMSFGCLFVLSLSIIMPFIATGYSLERAFLQLMVILSPLGILGCKLIFKKANLALAVILLLLSSQLMCNAELNWAICGEPHSLVLNSEGFKYDLLYIHDAELRAAMWLKETKDHDSVVYCDRHGPMRLWLARISETDRDFFKNNWTRRDEYIYLRYQNVVKKQVEPLPSVYKRPEEAFVPIANYSHLFVRISKIYDNGISQIYR